MNSLTVEKGFDNGNICYNDYLNITIKDDLMYNLDLVDNPSIINIDISNSSKVVLYFTCDFKEEVKFNIELKNHSQLELVYFSKKSVRSIFNNKIGENSILDLFVIDLCTNSKNEVYTDLIKEHATFNLKTASVCVKSSKSEFVIKTNHLNKVTNSSSISRSVVLDNSCYLNNTVGYIEKGCTHSKCHQDTKSIILGENAISECNPVLLIDEFDVEASHSAAVGKINEDDLYYLQSRGLGYNECIALLIRGFLVGIINDIFEEEFKDLLIKELYNSMEV